MLSSVPVSEMKQPEQIIWANYDCKGLMRLATGVKHFVNILTDLGIAGKVFIRCIKGKVNNYVRDAVNQGNCSLVN